MTREIDLLGLTPEEKETLTVTAGDELLLTLGRVRLSQRVPEGLRMTDSKATDWYGDAVPNVGRIGDVIDTKTPAIGTILVTGLLPPRGLPTAPADPPDKPKDAETQAFPAPIDDLEATIEQALAFAAAAKSDNTYRAYAADWRIFGNWCARRGLDHLPASPETVALFLADEAGRRAVPTLRRRLAAIGHYHKQEGETPPLALDTGTLKDVIAGISRTKGRKQKKATPLMPSDIRAMVDQTGDDLRGRRDKTLILVGFCGNFRRSEIVGITVPDVLFEPGGMRITLPFSKGDQEGEGVTKAIPRSDVHSYCPVAALEDWLEAAGIEKGPVFRTFGRGRGLTPLPSPICSDMVDRIVKRLAAAAGVEGNISAHSLRRGWMTSVAPAERPIAMAKHAGHKDISTSMGYIEDATAYDKHIGKGLL
jgi:integrase